MLGDTDQLYQVLLNLLSDAIKFTTQGHMRLGAGVLCDTSETLTVRFWVKKTDIGIAPE